MDLHTVINKLATLGSADQIALFMEDQKITGDRMEGASCPVSRYVTREAGNGWTQTDKKICYHVDGHVRIETVVLPEVVCEFVQNFDENCYPNLVKE